MDVEFDPVSPSPASVEVASLRTRVRRGAFWNVMRHWALRPRGLFKQLYKHEMVSKRCCTEDGVLLTERLDPSTFWNRRHDCQDEDPDEADHADDDVATVTYRRRILPRVPKDPVLEETVTLRIADDRVEVRPDFPPGERPSPLHLPIYYPKVKSFAFCYRSDHAPGTDDLEEPADGTPPPPGGLVSSVEQATLTLEVEFLDATTFRNHMPAKGREMLAKLDKWARGYEDGFKKQARHDVISSQSMLSTYIDTYARLKAKYKPWYEKWKDLLATDPQKHVSEDLAIAAFLITTWSKQCGAGDAKPTFIDVGCGNGLLVYLLTSEGYRGKGIDLVARPTWAAFGRGVSLEVCALDPRVATFSEFDWLIGNHCDELTPWVPYMAARSASPTGQPPSYFLLPCCFYDFAGKFSGCDPKIGKYATYLKWLSGLGAKLGYRVELETLRIPSTKSQAQIGRSLILPVGSSEREALLLAAEADVQRQSTTFAVRPPQPTHHPQKRRRPNLPVATPANAPSVDALPAGVL